MSEVLVVKLGGTTVAEQQAALESVGRLARRQPLVVVHGGGARVTDWSTRLGLVTRFEDGLRVTDGPALEVAAAVLRGLVNIELVAALRRLGCDAVGLSGVDGGFLVAERLPGKGYVAGVVEVRRAFLDALLVGRQVPVIAPLALDEHGEVCNVNADDVAAGIAAGIGARQLVLLTDVDGVRDAGGRRLAAIESAEAERLIREGVIAGGMIPKVRAALRAVRSNPGAEAIVADGGAPDALLRSLTDPEFGTRIRGPAEGGLIPGPDGHPAAAWGRP